MKNKIFIFSILSFLLFAGYGVQAVRAADEPPDPRIAIYVIPPIADEKILPTTAIPDGYISNEISIVGCPGEYEPASFVVHALDDIASLQIAATELEGESDSISSNNIDITVVKCWYQAGEDIWVGANKQKILTSELLLKDDSLVKVENVENYLKLTTGEYVWISDPTIVQVNINAAKIVPISELPVQDSINLQPVTIPANTNKQFWVTLKIPDGAAAGVYTGKIQLESGGVIIQEIDLQLEVLPIELQPSYLPYSLYYRAVLDSGYPNGSISSEYKSEPQMRVELEDMFKHGVTNPGVYQGFDIAFLPTILTMRNMSGMGGQPLYLFNVGLASSDTIAATIQLAQSYGVSEVYFYGTDEPQQVGAMRDFCDRVHAVGGKVFTAINNLSVGQTLADVLDLVISTPGIENTLIPLYHSFGNKVFSYANPQVGEERPERYRRNYGLYLWQKDYDGAMDYAYQHGYGTIWNDYDHSTYRDHNYAYPTTDGVINTIQWEGWREGVDDIRYLTTLLEVIEVGKAEGRDTSAAEDWLADLKGSDLTTKNLDTVRSEMIDHILSLQNQSQNQAPVLNPIGNKTVNEGELLSFTISATDANGDTLTYSASNLPQGASFSPSTRIFSWTPGQAGTYGGIHFEVSDGDLTDSEDITITVGNVNQPPVLNPIGNKTVNEGELLSFTISASDADGDSLTYSASNLPQGASFSPSTRIFSWTPGQAGTYAGIHFEVSDGVFTDPENITITVSVPTTPPPAIGGGGFMLVLPPPEQPGSTDVSNIIGKEGMFTETATIQSEDGKGVLTIQEGTKGLTKNGEALEGITIVEMQELPAPLVDSNIIGLVYNFGPDGATFDPSITVTFTYDKFLIPEGVDEKNAVIAMWDDEFGRWSEIESVVNPEANTIIGNVSHFSVYTILIHTSPAAFTTSGFLITPTEVYTSNTIKSSILVTNTGDVAGSYEVTLRIDGILVETKEVIVDGGNSQTVNFNNTQIYDPGTHTVDINGLMGTFEVKTLPTATFTTSELNISPNAAYLGDTVTISARINNTGNATGTYEVMLKIEGITEATKEVTVDASTTEMVSFTTMKNNAGTYTVDVNGMTGSFTVNEQLSPAISAFEVIPHYDTETGKLIFAEITYEVNNPDTPIVDVDLVVGVYLNAELFEEFSLLSTSQLELGETIGSLDYIPVGAWKTGVYTFQAKLYVNGELLTSMTEEKLEVTAEPAPTVVSWGILGMIISAMLPVIAITVFIVLRRRRYQFEA